MRRPLLLASLTLALSGCAMLEFPRPSPPLLARADQLAEQGDYEAAIAAYDDYLAKHADDRAAPRARTSRAALEAVLSARAEVARLRGEVAQLEGALARRETELARAREDLGRYGATLARLRAEVAQLEGALARRETELTSLRGELARRQTQLEQLKQIDERITGPRR